MGGASAEDWKKNLDSYYLTCEQYFTETLLHDEQQYLAGRHLHWL